MEVSMVAMQARLTEQALTVLRERYLAKDPETGQIIETPDDLIRRVARCIAESERLYGGTEATVEEIAGRFARLMAENCFWPNTPTLTNAGRPGAMKQYSACFVIPVPDSMEGIGNAITAALLIHKSGGGTGFSFSSLRPKGDRVRSSGGVASGPVSFMKIIDTATEQVRQGGTRRGANMGILSCDHPDIFTFIACKAKDGEIRNFNISVAVTDAFMRAVEHDADWPLINPRTGQTIRTVRARQVWDELVRHAWQNGEPGLFFIDRANADNPIPHLGRIEATNPCGEKPLLPWDACTLGHVNLEAHLVMRGDGCEIDRERLRDTVYWGVRFLDDVIDAADHPLPQINEMTRRTRQVGLGVMGLARVLIARGIPYDSEAALDYVGRLMADIRRWAWEASAELAAARGVYPAWPGSRHEAEGRKVRNSYVLTVAPTGTTSMIAHTSSGIEPEFSLVWHKRVMDGKLIPYICEPFERVAREEGWWTDDLLDRIIANHGSCRGLAGVPERWQRVFATAHDIAPEWHVRMQAAVQAHVDSAVSKTINLPASATIRDVADAFRLAWSLGCKGITVYRDGSRRDQVLNVGTASANSAEASQAGPSAHSASLSAPQNGRGYPMVLPSVLEAKRVRVDTPDGGIYVHIGYVDGKPVEVFTTTPEEAKHEEVYEAFARIFSIALQWGVPLEKLLKQLDGANRKYGSVSTIPAAILRAFRTLEPTKQTDAACPKCTGVLVLQEGCLKCLSCGWSKCE
jgi:ribonucleoside-diphosphate reductase alpha chain